MFFASRRLHTRWALVARVQPCALPIDRQDRPTPRYALALLCVAGALPGCGLAELVGKTYGLVYLAMAIAAAYLATAAPFVREGGPLNIFVAAIFVARMANILLYPLWETPETVPLPSAVGHPPALSGGLGLLLSGFAQTRKSAL